MFCPKCGNQMDQQGTTFRCVHGDMELSQHMATSLSESFGGQAPPLTDHVNQPPDGAVGSVHGAAFPWNRLPEAVALNA